MFLFTKSSSSLPPPPPPFPHRVFLNKSVSLKIEVFIKDKRFSKIFLFGINDGMITHEQKIATNILTVVHLSVLI